jgi:hypothetical protein
MLRAVLIAPPGAEEGAQGQRLGEMYGVPQVSADLVAMALTAALTPVRVVIAAEPMGRDLGLSNHEATVLLVERIFGSVSSSANFIQAVQAANTVIVS